MLVCDEALTEQSIRGMKGAGMWLEALKDRQGRCAVRSHFCSRAARDHPALGPTHASFIRPEHAAPDTHWRMLHPLACTYASEEDRGPAAAGSDGAARLSGAPRHALRANSAAAARRCSVEACRPRQPRAEGGWQTQASCLRY